MTIRTAFTLAFAATAVAGMAAFASAAPGAKPAAPRVSAAPFKGPTEEAVLGGGCFWCVEAALEELKGIVTVESGYAGGSVKSPSYEAVCTGQTGHAEVVKVVFDPKSISYSDVLRAFFVVHDPTTKNRQGNDAGTQYRSIILTESPAQVATAKRVMAELAPSFGKPFTTQVEPLAVFYPAEAYHQDYFAKNPDQPYCAFVVAPKVEKLRHAFVDKLKR